MAAQRIVHDSSSSSSGFAKSARTNQNSNNSKVWINPLFSSSGSAKRVESEVEMNTGQFSPSAIPPKFVEEKKNRSRIVFFIFRNCEDG